MLSLKPTTINYYDLKNVKNKTFSCRAASTNLSTTGSNKKTNLYELLSLDPDKDEVGFDEIKKAYRSMALRYHPDVCARSAGKEESTKMFVEVRRAYETLSDPRSRRAYDVELMMGKVDHERVSVRSRLSRDTWEAQLDGLARRSELRQRTRAGAGFGRRENI